MKSFAVVAAAALGLASAPVHAEEPDDASPAMQADGHARMLVAGLLGEQEVPTPGDPDGRGQFMAWPDADGQLCYKLMVNSIDAPVAAHIHAGAAGTAGGVTVALEAPADGKSEGCAAIDADAMNAIWADPSAFYVNVHNAEFPKGALRGQLMAHPMDHAK